MYVHCIENEHKVLLPNTGLPHKLLMPKGRTMTAAAARGSLSIGYSGLASPLPWAR